jgi:hypothetical protein
MADTSVFFITLYCNRFFCACQEKFCSFCNFFEKYFKRIQNCPENSAHQLPETGKYRGKQLADGLVKQQDSQGDPHAAAQTDIAPADPKGKLQPYPEENQDEQQVRRPASALAGGAEESVKCSQRGAHG